MTEPNLFDFDDDTSKVYAGTSGWSGSETSRERAEWQDEVGITSARDNNTLERLARAGADGLTWRELAERRAITTAKRPVPSPVCTTSMPSPV